MASANRRLLGFGDRVSVIISELRVAVYLDSVNMAYPLIEQNGQRSGRAA